MKTPVKTIALAAVAAVSVAGLSLPATAAPNDHRVVAVRYIASDHVIDHRIDTLETRISQGRRSGALNRNESTRLSSDLRDIKSLAKRYERTGHGIDRKEAATLDRRLMALEHRLMAARQDRRAYVLIR